MGKYLQHIETGEVRAAHRRMEKNPQWIACDGPDADPVIETVELTPPSVEADEPEVTPVIPEGFLGAPPAEDELGGDLADGTDD